MDLHCVGVHIRKCHVRVIIQQASAVCLGYRLHRLQRGQEAIAVLLTTNTVEVEVHPPTKEEKDAKLASAYKLVHKLLKPAPDGPWKWKRVQVALARALLLTSPGSHHGEILSTTLHRLAEGKRLQQGPQRAILWCASRSETPTEGAVKNRLDVIAGYREKNQRIAGLRVQALELASTSGPLAAEFTEKVVVTEGRGPTWLEVTHYLGATYYQCNHLIRALLSQGKIVQLPGHGNVPDKWKIQAL
jgi:hypothetical protein